MAASRSRSVTTARGAPGRMEGTTLGRRPARQCPTVATLTLLARTVLLGGGDPGPGQLLRAATEGARELQGEGHHQARGLAQLGLLAQGGEALLGARLEQLLVAAGEAYGVVEVITEGGRAERLQPLRRDGLAERARMRGPERAPARQGAAVAAGGQAALEQQDEGAVGELLHDLEIGVLGGLARGAELAGQILLHALLRQRDDLRAALQA